MSDLKALLPEKPNDERIRKWREERHKVAEAEKAERLRQRDLNRDRRAQEERAHEQAVAASLLPTADDLLEMQQQIIRHARTARRALWLQFSILCVLPLAAVAYYLFAIATPLYEARSVIAVTQPGTTSSPPTSGILGSLSSPINVQDVFMAHAYIQSQALMDALEADVALVSMLSSEAIDPAQRLRDIPSIAVDKRAHFDRFVDSNVDIQTGLITLFVRAPERAQATAVSENVLSLVAQQVNTLNADVNSQRLGLAAQTVKDAQTQLAQAQADFVGLQIQSGETNPKEKIAGIQAMIGQLQTQALDLSSEIQRAEVAGQSESFQTQRAIALRDRIIGQVEEQRALLTADGEAGLSALTMQHQLAALRVSIAEEALTTALAGLADTQKTTSMANSLFQVVVPPRTGAQPSAPNAPSILLVTLVMSLTVFALWRMTLAGRQTI